MSSTQQGRAVTPESERALWEKHDHLAGRVGSLENWKEVAQYQIEQQARDAATDRHRIGEQYAQLMSEIKAVGGRVHENEITHARQDGAKALGRWAVPILVSGGLGFLGLCLSVAALLWKVFGA